MSLKHIPLKELKPNRDNRKFDPKGLKTLARSIEEHGLLLPLAVRKDKSGYVIVDGHRRHAAIALLARAKKHKGDVPCNVIEPKVTDTELMVAANHEREEMHWADQCRLFAKSLGESVKAEDLAARFGYETKVVMRYAAIGQLPEKVLELARADKIDVDTAKALTNCPPAMVKELLPKLASGKVTDWQINQMLKEARFPVSKAFPGVEVEYVKRDGKIVTDLFAEDGEGRFFADRKLAIELQALAGQKRLDAAKEMYAAAQSIEAEKFNRHPDRHRWSDVKDKKRLSYFLVLHPDGSVAEETLYVAANDPKAPKAKKTKGAAVREVTNSNGTEPDTTLTKGTMALMNTVRAVAVRHALTGATVRMAMELCLTALFSKHDGGVIHISAELNPFDGSASMFLKEKDIGATNAAMLGTSKLVSDAFHKETVRHTSAVAAYRWLKSLDDTQLGNVFVSTIAALTDSLDRDNPMAPDSLFAEIAKDLKVGHSGYEVDRLYLGGVRSKDHLNAIAKAAGVEPGTKRAETIDRILKSEKVKTGRMLAPDGVFAAEEPKAEKPRKKAA